MRCTIAFLDKTSDWKLAVSLLHCFILSAPSLLSTLYIPFLIKANSLWEYGNGNTPKEFEIVPDNSSSQLGNGRGALNGLQNTLQNERKFNLFMSWMLREFSHENPLSFIEFVQFKRYILSINEAEEVHDHDAQLQTQAADTEEANATTVTIGNFNFNLEMEPRPRADINKKKYVDLYFDALPISSIISQPRPGLDDSAKCKDMAHALYAKYIDSRAPLEINIDWELRLKYRRHDDENWEMSMDDMVTVFDPAIRETHNFMYQSFCRFKANFKPAMSSKLASPVSKRQLQEDLSVV